MIIDRILLLKINFVETFGYLLTFLATFLEASPLIGLFIPGSIIIFFAGFFAKLGLLNYWEVMIIAILGAILGDLAGYLFGRYSGKRFLHRYGRYFLIRREFIDKSEEIAHGHTGKSLVIGRLNPLTRSAAPFIVGCHNVKFWKFMVFNIIGGILWGFIFVSLGYLFGHGYGVAESIEKYILVFSLIIIFAFYFDYFMKIIFRKVNGNSP
jgi:membrane-associated protein